MENKLGNITDRVKHGLISVATPRIRLQDNRSLTHRWGSETVPFGSQSEKVIQNLQPSIPACWVVVSIAISLTNETTQDPKHDKWQAKMVIGTMKTALITLAKAIWINIFVELLSTEYLEKLPTMMQIDRLERNRAAAQVNAPTESRLSRYPIPQPGHRKLTYRVSTDSCPCKIRQLPLLCFVSLNAPCSALFFDSLACLS